MEKLNFTRRELYELLWTNSLVSLSKKYNISDLGLRKVALKMGIPLPPVGYWNKLAAGKAVPKSPLLPDGDFTKEVKLSLRSEGSPLEEVGISSQILLERELKLNPEISFVVPKTLLNPESETLLAKKALEKSLSKSSAEGLFRTTDGQIDIWVGSASIDRALLLMDTFLKVIRKRKLMTYDGEFINVYKKTLKFRILEGKQKVPETLANPYPDYEPTGILTMKFEGLWVSVSAKDGKERLETQLAKLVAKLELLIPRFEKEEKEQAERNRIWEEDRKSKQAIEDRRLSELQELKQLIKDFKRWEHVKRLREYLCHLESASKEANKFDEKVESFLLWAKDKADWLDPAIEKDDEWLYKVNKDELFEDLPNSARNNSSYNYSSGNNSRDWLQLPWYLKK